MSRPLLPHPLASIFPRVTAESRQDLILSLEKGYDENHPIWTYKGMILDGYNRYTLAAEINKRRSENNKIVPIFREFKGDDDAAFDFVLQQNLRRRHLSESERAGLYVLIEKRTGRQVRGIGEAAAERSSIVSKSAPSGRTLPTVGLTNKAKVVDARCAPRTLAKARQLDRLDPKALESVVYRGQSLNGALLKAKAAAKAAEEPKPPVELDEAKRPIHPAALEALTSDRAKFTKLILSIRAAKRAAKELSATPAGRLLRWDALETDFENLIRMLRFSAPYTSCPMGDPCDDACKLCKGSQWVSESQWANVPREFKGKTK